VFVVHCAALIVCCVLRVVDLLVGVVLYVTFDLCCALCVVLYALCSVLYVPCCV